MEPQSGIIIVRNRPTDRPTTRPHQCLRLSPPIMSVPTYFVCPHLLCLSPPIMSVPTYYVCPHLLCLSPPIMFVPNNYVCPHLLCLSPPNMSVPSYYVCPPNFFSGLTLFWFKFYSGPIICGYPTPTYFHMSFLLGMWGKGKEGI